jgi:hypothetical protein
MKKNPNWLMMGSPESLRELSIVAPYSTRIDDLKTEKKYAELLKLSREMYKALPKNRFAIWLFASSLFDSRKWVSKKQIKPNLIRSCMLFDKLVSNLDGIHTDGIKLYKQDRANARRALSKTR